MGIQYCFCYNLWCIQGLARTLEGKRPLGRPRRRWEDNIKMDLEEMGLGYGLV